MIKTRLTERFGLSMPILSAPMAAAGGGALAAAVTRAGGLGLIGGGYCDAEWIEKEFRVAGNTEVGVGFITWALAEVPALLTRTLERRPSAIFLSFGDPMPFAAEIAAAGTPLICQVQTVKDARRAVDAGATVIVAQGAEAGGHGEARATLTLVPEIADMLTASGSDALLLAAGGIADGRGLAAVLMLGADGALVGSRLWASAEALVPDRMQRAAVSATGDETIRATVMDIARGKSWPDRYSCRVLENPVTDRWHGKEAGFAAHPTAKQDWLDGWNAGDPARANTFVGEATGLIRDIRPASDILATMVAEAEACLRSGHARITGSLS